MFNLLVILVLSGSNMASKTPSRHSKAPPRASKTPSRTSKTPPKTPPRRPQELAKRSHFFVSLSLSDMPSLCQVLAKSLPDCQIRQKCMPTMVKHNGPFCEVRRMWPSTRGGLAVVRPRRASSIMLYDVAMYLSLIHI